MPKIILVGGFLKSQTHALNNLAYMDRQSSLFDENGQEITVREAQQAVRDTESIIWRHYVSFRREDVERLSVDREYMKALVTLKKAALAKTYHIAPENLRAFCSWHNKDHHPHMHMIFFSTKRREGYLIPTKGKTAKEAMNAATERMKAAYAREVFREELTPVYEQKTQVRDQLSENVEEQLRTITKERYKVDPALTKDLRALGKEIRALEGRKYYMYLPPELKEKVDGMLRRLVDNDPNAGKLFEEYRTTQQEIVKTYAENPISVAKKMKEWENDFFHPAQGGDSKRHNMMREAPLEGTDKLQQQIKEMCDNFKRDPKQYMEYLRFAGQFYQYSIRNRMLIYRQNPYATFVASRTAWNQKEAHILPDQQLKGISILRPITTELIKRENDWVAVRMATNEEREKIAKGELKIYEKTYFAISKVYDISQTDFPKDRYPEIYSMGQKSMDHAEVYACVKELARASGIPVKKEQLPSISLHGYYSPSENAITINSNLEDTKAAVTLCHEYAHGLLHRTSTQSEAICEFEAQSLALMLMARYGLPQDDSEIGYMKTYLERANNDKNFSLDTSLERLQKQLKFVDERISLIAEHRQTEFAQTRAQAREPGKGKQVSENFRVGL